jgi:hypothetical protein
VNDDELVAQIRLGNDYLHPIFLGFMKPRQSESGLLQLSFLQENTPKKRHSFRSADNVTMRAN